MNDDVLAYLDRRQLLKYLGNFAVLLPFYRVLLETQALAASPGRVLCCYYPNGVHRPSFYPTQNGGTLTFPEVTRPLSALASELLFIQGMRRSADGSHEAGAMNLYTGCGSPEEVKRMGQGSVFNYVASKIGGQSLNLGVASSLWGDSFDKTVSFNKDGSAGLVEDNPEAAFAKIFGGNLGGGKPTSDTNAAYLKKANKSILDASLADIQALKLRVGTDEKIKLEEHLQEVRALEQRIVGDGSDAGMNPVALNGCQPGANLLGDFKIPANDNGYPKYKQLSENYGRISKIMMDIMVQALACGVTRVGFLQWSCTVSPIEMNFAGGSGVGGAHHDVSHYGGSPANYNKNQAWYMGQFAYLIEALKAVKEGDGTLLDSLFGMAGTCINDGDAHGNENMPYFLFGHANGGIKTNRIISINKSHNALLISLLQSMGIQEDTFGNKTFATGPATEIRG